MATKVKSKSIFEEGLQIPSGAGTNKVLTSDISGNAIWADPAGGGGGSPADAPIVVNLNAASTYTITGLNGDADELYELVFIGTCSTNSGYVYVRPNGDSGSNYRWIRGYVGTWSANPGLDGTTSSGLLLGNPQGINYYPMNATMRLAAKSGVERLATVIGTGRSSDLRADHAAGVWTNTASNITSLTVLHTEGTMTGTLILRKLKSPSTLLAGPRIVRGIVAGNGDEIAGEGFTIDKTSAGTYTINFADDFAAPPVVRAVPRGVTGTGRLVLVDNETPSSARVRMVRSTDGGLLDDSFSFDAIDSSSTSVKAWTAPQRVTSLPAGQPDGQEVYFQPDPTNNPGVIWHMRYDSAAAKWDWLGGTPLRVESIGASLTAAAGAWQALGLSLTAPVAGSYEIEIGAVFNLSATGWTTVAAKLGSATPTGAEGVQAWSGSGNGSSGSHTMQRTIGAAGTVISTQGQRMAAESATFPWHYLAIRPIRIG